MDFISAICYLVLTIGIIVIGLAILTFLFYEKRYGIAKSLTVQIQK